MLELSQLEQLAAVAQYGTLSKAAEALNTSQPVLSRTMRRLEEELQVSLFDRQKISSLLPKAGTWQWRVPKRCWRRSGAWWNRCGPLTAADTRS